jgi:hypothetical protein
MSLEALSSGISAVATAPSVGSRIGHAASSFSSKMGASGGSFSPSLNGANIFSETRPFVASAGAVREGPIPKTGNIFSGPKWSTLGRADTPAVHSMPKADPMRGLGFEPFVAKPTTIAEKSISLNKGEWRTLATAPAKTIAETVFPKTKPLMPENPAFSKIVGDKDLTILVESAYKSTPVEESIISKSLIAEKEQSKKVVNLLAEVGLYTREEAANRVAKIVEKRGLVESEAEIATETKAEEKVMPMPDASLNKVKIKTKNMQVEVEVEDEDKKPEDKLLKKKLPGQVAVVDEKAQANRKKEVKEKISSLFRQARWFGLEKINSKDIIRDLDKNRENRSLLLRQLMYPLLPDGSLDEAAKTVESFGELRDASLMAQQAVEEQVEEIFDKNVPVKLSKETSKQVTENDVKRVLKYIQPESVVG